MTKKRVVEIISFLATIATIAGVLWAIFTYFKPSRIIVPEPIPISTPQSTPKLMNTPALSPTLSFTPIPSATANPQVPDSASSLIPKGQQPVVNDPLNNNSEGYGWDEGPVGGGSCSFVPGQHYVLSAPAHNAGVGCNAENRKGFFSNCVYQIRMTILEGIDDGVAGEAGPTFRVNDKGSEYQVSFDVNGYWSVTYNGTALSSATTPFPYFHSGVDQPNYITIRAVGSSIQVQVNGHDLGSFTDSNDADGFIGVEMTPGSDVGKVAFSNVRVWQIEG